MKERTPALCPVCGDAVPPGAKACPTCGACEKSGWKPDAVEDGEDDTFDYDEFIAQEFGGGKAGKRRRGGRPPIGWFWWAVAVAVLAGTAWVWVRW